MRITLAEAVERYGAIQSGWKWPDESKWCVNYAVPLPLQSTWINAVTGRPTARIYVNREMVEALDAALGFVVERGLAHLLKTFDGCYAIRDVRGEPGKPSCHSYACAIDINAATNALGTEGDMDTNLAKCFTDAGFTWGGHFPRKDYMHFSLAWE